MGNLLCLYTSIYPSIYAGCYVLLVIFTPEQGMNIHAQLACPQPSGSCVRSGPGRRGADEGCAAHAAGRPHRRAGRLRRPLPAPAHRVRGRHPRRRDRRQPGGQARRSPSVGRPGPLGRLVRAHDRRAQRGARLGLPGLHQPPARAAARPEPVRTHRPRLHGRGRAGGGRNPRPGGGGRPGAPDRQRLERPRVAAHQHPDQPLDPPLRRLRRLWARRLLGRRRRPRQTRRLRGLRSGQAAGADRGRRSGRGLVDRHRPHLPRGDARRAAGGHQRGRGRARQPVALDRALERSAYQWLDRQAPGAPTKWVHVGVGVRS